MPFRLKTNWDNSRGERMKIKELKLSESSELLSQMIRCVLIESTIDYIILKEMFKEGLLDES